MKRRRQPFDPMPKRGPDSTARNPTPLRRSPRLLRRYLSPETADSKTPRPYPDKKTRARDRLGKKSAKSEEGSRGPGNSETGLRRSQRLSVGLKKTRESAEKGEAKRRYPRRGVEVEEVTRCVQNREVGSRCCVLGLAAAVDNKGVGEADRTIQMVKRNTEEEALGSEHGWSKEQEMALQRAYLAAKPTPSFWKKVSKMVPGKSAQECFDKFNSDLATPQPRCRSRAAKARASLGEPFPLSASKILNPVRPANKISSRNKTKSHLVQRTARQLLQKHYQTDQTTGADLFSILEPDVDLSAKVFNPSCMFSTPETARKKQGFLHNFRERSSSSSKKSLSRFHNTGGVGKVISPPVLKPVKNRNLHEKYLDQLHNREARRNAVSVGNKVEDGLKIDVVRAAKEALVSDARDAIQRLQDLRDNSGSQSRDVDDDCGNDEDEDDVDNVLKHSTEI